LAKFPVDFPVIGGADKGPPGGIFSVTIRKRNEGSFAAANLDLKRFAGKRLRVRGWVEARGGVGGSPWHAPWIEAVYPEQIETADQN
jgi:hypothetical protein